MTGVFHNQLGPVRVLACAIACAPMSLAAFLAFPVKPLTTCVWFLAGIWPRKAPAPPATEIVPPGR